MGAVLTPALIGVEKAEPSAQRLDLLRPLRGSLPGAHPAAEADAALARARIRAASVARDACAAGLRFWAFFAKRPRLYRFATGVCRAGARLCWARRGRFRWLPLAGGWTRHRDFPAPQGRTFQAQWKQAGAAAMSARDAMLCLASAARSACTGERAAAPRTPSRSGSVAIRAASSRRAGSAAAERVATVPHQMVEAAAAHRRGHADASPTCPARSRRFCARITCPMAGAPRRRSAARRHAVGARAHARGATGALRRPRSRRRCQPRVRGRRRNRHARAGCRGRTIPTTLNFLPDNHIVVVDAKDVAGDYETLWQRAARDATAPARMPRTVNLITGPSRSADIEQTLILGAHGPRRLHVLVVGSS